MQDYQQRVVDEEKALREKFDKLEIFISGDAFQKVPQGDQALLQEQRGYMSGYLSVLARRIERFAVSSIGGGHAPHTEGRSV